MTTLAPPETIESPSDSLDAESRPRRRVPWAALGLAALLLLYAGLLAAHFSPAIIHPDANGYWAQASLLVKTGHSWFRPDSDAQYIGMHWLLTPDGTFISRYPPGLPALVGVVYALLGPQASVAVNPVLATLTLVGIYLVASKLTSPAWGLLAAALTAANAAFTVHALTSISHTAVAFCLVWGVWCLLKWSSTPGPRRLAWAAGAGVILGCIPSVRYPDCVVAVGVIAFMLCHWRAVPHLWKHLLAAGGGAFIAVLPLLVRNQLLLGGFWRTGYALTNESTGFSWAYFTQHFLGYLQLLQSSGLGLLFGLGLIGFAWMLCVPRRRAAGVLLIGAAVPMLLLYMAYYWAQGIGGGGPGGGGGGGGGGGAGAMRFYVPVVPLFVIAGVYALFEATRAAPRAAKVAVPLIVLAPQLTLYGSGLADELGRDKARKVPLALATAGLKEVAADGDVVVAPPAVLQDLDFIRAWKLADPSLIGNRGGFGGGNGGGRRGGARDPNGPAPQQAAKAEARAELYPGDSTERRRHFLADVRAWAGGGSIYVIAGAGDVTTLLPGVPSNQLAEVKRIPTPKPPVEENDQTGPGGPGGPGIFGGNRRGGRRGAGGPFGSAVQPGEDLVILRWTPPADRK